MYFPHFSSLFNFVLVCLSADVTGALVLSSRHLLFVSVSYVLTEAQRFLFAVD